VFLPIQPPNATFERSELAKQMAYKTAGINLKKIATNKE